MTRRIMIVLGALSLVLVLTAGIVIGAGLYREAGREVQISRSRSLAFLAALAAEAETTGDTGSLRAAIDRYRDLFEERVVVEIGGLRLASDPGPLPAGVEAELARARADLGRADLDALRPFRPEPQFLSRPFGTATQIRGAVLIEVDPALAVARADARLLTLLGVAVLVEGVLLASIVLIARWILRPVRHLSGALGTLGRSERLDPLADEGPPELRELTQQFRGMAEALTSTLDRQRAVLGETSHQLRNALAGVLLRLDVLELSPAADHPARIAELGAELARLEHTLEGMMKLADAEHRIASRHVASVS
ncbi:HAMP domain-containing protein, partial [Leucobacter sp. M11]|uniref:HAMP domain-containing protein n=1 Tax=Leucobacter sp. M11 TaxID=2993565 RepID=UPI002D7EF696